MSRLASNALRLAAVAMLALIAWSLRAGESTARDGPQAEYSAAPSREDRDAAVETAVVRVAAARTRAEVDPFGLVEALAALGDAGLDQSDYVSAQAAYEEALKLAEQHGGANNAALVAPLRGLGNALASSGLHKEAVPHLARALTIVRATYGLFDARQLETLQLLARSSTAIGRSADAEDHMLYSVRVAEKTYGEGDPRVVPAFCDLGDWFSEVGKPGEARMAFQVALNIVESKLGSDDVAAVAPLRKLADSYMQELTYRKSARRPRGPRSFSAVDAKGAQLVPSGKLSLSGERALQRALQILGKAQVSGQTLIDTLIQTGDWFQVKKAPRQALPYYQRASQLIAAESSQPGSAAPLSFPVRVYYSTPSIASRNPTLATEETEVHYVQVEFTVMADGSVFDARLVEHDTTQRYAAQILDAVRAARFRPRFIDGQPVPTPGITYREVVRTPRMPSRD